MLDFEVTSVVEYSVDLLFLTVGLLEDIDSSIAF